MQEFNLLLFLEFISGNYFNIACLSLMAICTLVIWRDRKLPKIPPEKTDARDSAESGSVFFALFAAVGMVGILAASTSSILRGPVTTMSEITRRTVAENAMMAAARLSVVMAGTIQPSGGDCDADGTVEPIPYRDPGTGIRPTGGGYLPTSIGAQTLDPWQTEYGYCVWDHGPTLNAAGCGGVGQRRLAGAPASSQIVIGVLSAGKDKIFQTTCNAYADANTDNIPDTPLLNKPGGSDDILHSYTYAEAMGVGDGIWRLKSGAPGVAEVDKNLEVKDAGGTVTAAIDRTSGVGNFIGVTTNSLTPRSGTGIEIGGGLKLGNDTAACPGAANIKIGTMRYNGTVMEICTTGGWTGLTGTGSGNIQSPVTPTPTAGAPCTNVGELGRSGTNQLLVCEDVTITNVTCNSFGTGALSFSSNGAMHVCKN